jgi:parvulin-like peptidyl-prolyl isomerase
VKVDILKSRLASSVMQSGVGISEEEIQEYIDRNPQFSGSGTKLKLAHIIISEEKHGEEGARILLEAISDKLDDGEDFAEVARAHSDSTDAVEGGLLGIIAQKDLSSDIFESISSLKSGEVSKPVRTAQGYQIFQVVEQFVEDEDSEGREKLKEEVRRTLQRQKLAHKMNSFFTAELMKTHTVDRKI